MQGPGSNAPPLAKSWVCAIQSSVSLLRRNSMASIFRVLPGCMIPSFTSYTQHAFYFFNRRGPRDKAWTGVGRQSCPLMQVGFIRGGNARHVNATCRTKVERRNKGNHRATQGVSPYKACSFFPQRAVPFIGANKQRLFWPSLCPLPR